MLFLLVAQTEESLELGHRTMFLTVHTCRATVLSVVMSNMGIWVFLTTAKYG